MLACGNANAEVSLVETTCKAEKLTSCSFEKLRIIQRMIIFDYGFDIVAI